MGLLAEKKEILKDQLNDLNKKYNTRVRLEFKEKMLNGYCLAFTHPKIVLGEELLDVLTIDENKFVLLHEYGHHKFDINPLVFKFILLLLVSSLIVTIYTIFQLSESTLLESASIPYYELVLTYFKNTFSFQFLISASSFVSTLFIMSLVYARSREYRADLFAIKYLGCDSDVIGSSLTSLIKRQKEKPVRFKVLKKVLFYLLVVITKGYLYIVKVGVGLIHPVKKDRALFVSKCNNVDFNEISIMYIIKKRLDIFFS